MKVPVVFFGTPEFAVPALEALVKSGYKIAAVVTQPDKPVGRGLKMEASVVKVKAQELGLNVLQPDTLKTPAALEIFKSLNIDLAVCIAYGKIIPKSVLDLFPRGVLNIHPSLLPKYRGPSPIQSAIANGDSETGVTIMLLDEETDHGAILTQHAMAISPSPSPLPAREGGRRPGEGPTGAELSKLLAQEGAKLLIKTLPQWLNRTVEPLEQDHAKATFTKLLEREDGRINWQQPAEQIERIVRAYDLWPGTWTTWPAPNSAQQNLKAGKRLKILRATLLHPTIGCANNATPGYVWKTDDGRLAINCNPGSVIFEKIQLEGKKPMTGQEFLHGYPKILSCILN